METCMKVTETSVYFVVHFIKEIEFLKEKLTIVFEELYLIIILILLQSNLL